MSGRRPEVVRVVIGINRSQEGVEFTEKAVTIVAVDLVEADRNHFRDDRIVFLGGAEEPSQEEELGANQDRIGGGPVKIVKEGPPAREFVNTKDGASEFGFREIESMFITVLQSDENQLGGGQGRDQGISSEPESVRGLRPAFDRRKPAW